MAGGGIKISNIKVNGGADGATFVPEIDQQGNLSWSNNKGYTNPQTVNIKGPKGENGKDGIDGAKLLSQELIGQDEQGGNIYKQTFSDGTEAYFTAPKGEQGEQGVGISAITSGTATESGGYTVTPITFEKTDGSTQTVEIKATGGITEERVKELIDEEVGEIETALDGIIAIQNTLIGGGV